MHNCWMLHGSYLNDKRRQNNWDGATGGDPALQIWTTARRQRLRGAGQRVTRHWAEGHAVLGRGSHNAGQKTEEKGEGRQPAVTGSRGGLGFDGRKGRE